MSSSKKNYNKSIQQKNPSPLFLLPFILTIIIVPLIIRLATIENHLEGYGWHGSSTTTTDLFLYYKSVAFLVFSAIMLITLVYYLISSKRKFIKSPVYIPLLVYVACIIFSTIFSEHVYFSFHGIENHFESVFVLLGYCLFVFYASYFVTCERNLNWVLYGWLIGTIILVLIGVGQALELDIFTTEFIKKIILPRNMWDSALRLKFPLGKVYITLYNPNYIGYFGCLTIPVFLIMTLVSKKIWQKAVWGITLVGLMICLFGSEAKNGMIGLAGSILVLIVAFRRKIIKLWPYILGGCALLLITFFGINAIKDNYLIESIKVAFNTADQQVTSKLQAVETQKDCIAIKYDNELLFVQSEIKDSNSTSATFTFVDSTGTEIPYVVNPETKTLSIDDKRFPFTIQLVKYSDITCFQINIENTEWVFTNRLSSDGTYYYLNAIGKWVSCVPSESAVFTKHPYFASSRGFIWAKSIPLLKQNILLGSGPDTFVFEYPHSDYAASVSVGLAGMVVSKPHNLYLQIGVQTGVVSMIAVIVFYLLYLILTIRQYWKHKLDTLFSQVGVAICASTFGYMISGLANDSTITYSFVYWGLMGLGIAVNYLSKQEDERIRMEAKKSSNPDTRIDREYQKTHPGKKYGKKR